MNETQVETVSRGRRNPTSAWIEAYNGKRGKAYRIRWVDPITGQRASEPCGRDKALARHRRDAKRAELRDGAMGKLPDKTLSDLKSGLETFMAGKSVHTVRKTKTSLADLISLCGERRLIHVDRAMLMDFRAQRLNAGVRIATANKDARQIKSALSYAVDAGWLKSNPLWRWKGLQLREPEKRIRVVELDEFSQLLKACDNPKIRVLLIVAYQQGLRRTELANLRWAAVDLERGVLHVENVVDAGEFTKSRKARAMPLLADVQRELSAMYADVPKIVKHGGHRPKYPHCFTWPDGSPFKPDWLTRAFAGIVGRADIDHCSLHDLRRSWSTLAQRAGVDKATVKDMGGWSTIAVVERHYTGETPEVFERATEKIQALHGVA